MLLWRSIGHLPAVLGSYLVSGFIERKIFGRSWGPCPGMLGETCSMGLEAQESTKDLKKSLLHSNALFGHPLITREAQILPGNTPLSPSTPKACSKVPRVMHSSLPRVPRQSRAESKRETWTRKAFGI